MATPDAPTNLIEINKGDDRSVEFTPNPLYLINQHEFSLDNGSTFQDCQSSIINIDEDTFYNLDDVQIRVKAIGGDTASSTLNNVLGFVPDELSKSESAEPLTLIMISGQSQASGTTNGTSIPSAEGLSWENGTPLDWDTQANQNDKSAFTPSFMIAEKSISGNTTCSVATAVGGTPLQDIPELGGSNWSETGDLRYEAIKEFLPCLDYFRKNLGYRIEKVFCVFAGGETDAGQYAQGNTSTPNGYKEQLISFADYCYNAADINFVSIASLGRTVSGDDNTALDLFRTDGQYEAIDDSSRLFLDFDGSRDFVDQGRMHDDIHWEQQGLNEWGQRLAEKRNNIETPLPTVDVPTTEFLPTTNIVVINQFDSNADNSAISNEALLTGEPSYLQGGATLSNLATPFDWGQGLVINGTGGYLEYPTTPDKTDSKTYFFRLKIDDYFTKLNNSLCGDMYGFSGPSGTRHAGHCITGFLEFENITIWVNNRAKSLNIPSELIVGAGWVDFCYYIDFTDTIPKAQGYLNGVGYGEATLDESSGAPETWNPPVNEFTIGACLSKGGDYGELVNAFYVDDFRVSNIVDTQSIVNYTSTKEQYNSVNTPVTPDAPVIDIQDNDDNIITWTASGPTEVRYKTEPWFDQESPLNVDYTVDTTYEVGEIEIRVKAEGVNPASGITTNTIAFTAATQIEYSTYYAYANDLDMVDTESVKVNLIPSIVQYKSDGYIRSEILTFTPDSDGKITFVLPDSDNMVGEHYYQYNFGNGIRYKAQAPLNTEEESFWTLNPKRI